MRAERARLAALVRGTWHGATRWGRRIAGRSADAPTPPVYPGDYDRPLVPTSAPCSDDHADPGEVVWAWVPFEEDYSRGKDRPVLVVGRDGPWLLALPVTSKDHDRDAAQEAACGRHWVDLGAGAWDSRHRPSEARVDRIVRLSPESVRRTGSTLNPAVFRRVAAQMAAHPPAPGRASRS